MKAVILAGGLGLRLAEETHLRPKPMVEVGGKAYSLAHPQDIQPLRNQRIHNLLWLQGLHDQRIFCELLFAY